LPTLSAKFVAEFGDGYSVRNLARMIRLAEVFPDRKIVSTLSRQLGWSHFVAIIPLKDNLQRDFYAEMCRVERWSVRTLRAKVQSMLFERTGLPRKPAEPGPFEVLVVFPEAANDPWAAILNDPTPRPALVELANKCLADIAKGKAKPLELDQL
jgi:hypothetical protein